MILGEYYPMVNAKYLELMRAKLGLRPSSLDHADRGIIDALLEILAHSRVDYHRFFRVLSEHIADPPDSFSLFPSALNQFFKANNNNNYNDSHTPGGDNGGESAVTSFRFWYKMYMKRMSSVYDTSDVTEALLRSRDLMLRSNPVYCLRNYYLQNVITAAENGDYDELEEYFDVLSSPFQKSASKLIDSNILNYPLLTLITVLLVPLSAIVVTTNSAVDN